MKNCVYENESPYNIILLINKIIIYKNEASLFCKQKVLRLC